MDLAALKASYLVGGTALSLLFGHRISEDLDLFMSDKLDREKIIDELDKTFGDEFKFEDENAFWGLFCYIKNIKVDIVKYPHLLLHPPVIIEGIRMYHTDDIVAMKINALLGRGKKKDFWDLAELSKYYSIEHMIELYQQKFPNQMLLISIPHALTYFEEADEGEDPISLNGQNWEQIKNCLRELVRDYLK